LKFLPRLPWVNLPYYFWRSTYQISYPFSSA
jgi:hypothetical protein